MSETGNRGGTREICGGVLPTKSTTECSPGVPRCADFDADCNEIEDKLWCWLYDPAKGYCPWLRGSTQSMTPESGDRGVST